MRRIVSRALRQDPPLVIGSDNAPELLTIKLEGAVLTLSVAEELLTSLERLCVNAAAERSADIQAYADYSGSHFPAADLYQQYFCHEFPVYAGTEIPMGLSALPWRYGIDCYLYA